MLDRCGRARYPQVEHRSKRQPAKIVENILQDSGKHLNSVVRLQGFCVECCWRKFHVQKAYKHLNGGGATLRENRVDGVEECRDQIFVTLEKLFKKMISNQMCLLPLDTRRELRSPPHNSLSLEARNAPALALKTKSKNTKTNNFKLTNGNTRRRCVRRLPVSVQKTGILLRLLLLNCFRVHESESFATLDCATRSRRMLCAFLFDTPLVDLQRPFAAWFGCNY